MIKSNILKIATNTKKFNKMDEKDCLTSGQDYFSLKTWLPYITVAIVSVGNMVAVMCGKYGFDRKYGCRTLRQGYFGLNEWLRTLRQPYFRPKPWLPHVTAALLRTKSTVARITATIFPTESMVAAHYGNHISDQKHGCRTLRQCVFY